MAQPYSLADLDPFAVEPAQASSSSSAARPPHRPVARSAQLDEDLLGLDDPLSVHAAAEDARRAEEARAEAARTAQRRKSSRDASSTSPPRRMARRMSSTPAIPLESGRDNAEKLYHPPSSPPASTLLAHFAHQQLAPRPVPSHTDSDSAFSDFQSAPASPGSMTGSLRSTWSNVKASSAKARPALANLFSEPSSYHDDRPSPYFSGAPGFAGERAMSSHPSHRNGEKTPQRTQSPMESSLPPPIHLTGVREGLTTTLTEEIAEGIRPGLPPRIRLSGRWTLLYSIDQHGSALSTLYKRVSLVDSPCVLVVRDGEGAIFGAYLNEPLKRSDAYYGTGECFLWKTVAFAPGDFRVGVGVKSFKWTGRNTYCILSTDGFISVGGGDGKYGLWVDGALERGFSAPCPAFDNDCLCTKATEGAEEAQCEVLALEVWRIGPS